MNGRALIKRAALVNGSCILLGSTHQYARATDLFRAGSDT